MKKIVAVIPARYECTRFPGKPLAKIAGKSMIQWVYEAVKKEEIFYEVIVATDDERIKEEVQEFGGSVIMTGVCSCGTERVYQAVKGIQADIIVNIQGDEPLIKGEMLQDLLKAFEDEGVMMATLKKEIVEQEEIQNTNVVKVVTDIYNDAIYFSRYPVPFIRENNGMKVYKHIGVYDYKKDFLEKYVHLSHSKLENAECLEQLRVLENGYKIRVLETTYETIGVDTKEQLADVENYILTSRGYEYDFDCRTMCY